MWQLAPTLSSIHTHPCKNYRLYTKNGREFLFVKGNQKKEFDMVMPIDVTTGNYPMRRQRLANITCYTCGQNGHYRKDCPSSAGTSLVPDQTLTKPMYSPPTTVEQMVTVPFAVPQSSLVAILKELAK